MSFVRRIQVSGHLSVSFLYPSEELYASQASVGLYTGKEKAPDHQNGTVHVTSHRLLYIDEADPVRYSLELSLSYIRETEGYAGFLRSSPKIILYLGHLDGNSDGVSDEQRQNSSSFDLGWICPICSYSNPPTLGDSRPHCILCGVVRPEETASNLAGNSAQEPVATPNNSGTPPQEPDSSLIACPACTFLNHPSLAICEMCSTQLRTSRPSTRPPSPFPEVLAANMIKLSFRKGGEPQFYAALKRALLRKGWQTPVRSDTPEDRVRLGINGIMQTVKFDSEARNEGMQASFKDLEALMINAKEMVDLAERLNESLTTYETTLPPGQTVDQPEEASFIRSSLFRLGLSGTALTRDLIKDEEEYHTGLAKELVEVLQKAKTGKAIMGSKGILGLDEVWAAWNRARGVALLPPETLLEVVPLLPRVSDPALTLRTFKSGLLALCTPQFGPAQFRTRLVSRLNSSPATAMDIAREEAISVSLATELIESVEESGGVIRDEGSRGELIWWVNVFERFVWDGTMLD